MPPAKTFDEEMALDRAMDLFWRRGYAATSAQDLVDELKISRSSLYGSFGSKPELYLLAIERYCALEAGPRHELLSGPGSAVDAIAELLAGLVTALDEHPDHRGCLVVNAAMERIPADPATGARVALQLGRLENALHDTVRRGMDDGEIDAGRDARGIARFLTTIVQGMRVVGKVGDRAALTATVDEVVRALRA